MKIKNKLQECIKHIKTMLYTKLCVSLKKDTNKQIDNKEKNNNTNVENTDKKLIISDVMFRFLCLIPLIGGLFILLTKQIEWYDRNKKMYHIWFIPSTAYLIVLLIIYYIGTLG